MAIGQQGKEKAGIIGRTLRLMLGMLIGWMTFTAMRFEDAAFHLLVLMVVLGLMAFYTGLLVAINKYGQDTHRWFGAMLVTVPVVLLLLVGGHSTRMASAAYVGVSLLLQAVRGDIGSEVMLIPSVLLNRPTYLVGALFFPIDWLESHLSGPGGMPG